MTELPATDLSPRVRWRPRPNPVLRRELVERWRGRRAFVVLTVHLGLLTSMLLLLLWAGSRILSDGFLGRSALDQGPTLGRFLFENVFGLVLLLVLFVGPGYAAAQIAQERERRTLGLLQITLVSPWRIVTGKLGAASAWLLLLVAAAAPMAAAAFFLGGVTVPDLLRGVAHLAVTTVAIAAIGIGVSAVTRRTVSSVVVTYGIVLLLVGGTVFSSLVELAVDRGEERPTTMVLNPFYGLADAVRADDNVELPSILTPFAAVRDMGRNQFGFDDGPEFAPVPMPAPMGEVFLREDAVVAFEAERVPLGAMPFPPDGDLPLDARAPREPVWLWVLAVHAAMGGIGLLVATRWVRPGREPGMRRAARSSGTRTIDAPDLPPPPPIVEAAP